MKSVLSHEQVWKAIDGLGARYDLTKTVALRGEWERFRIGTAGLGGKSDVDMFSLNAIMKF